jgi:hypothetical protein
VKAPQYATSAAKALRRGVFIPAEEEGPKDLVEAEAQLEGMECGLYNTRAVPDSLPPRGTPESTLTPRLCASGTLCRSAALQGLAASIQHLMQASQMTKVCTMSPLQTGPCVRTKVHLQEYLDINKPILELIVSMGSNSATPSDAARSWLLIQRHFEQLQASALSRISTTPKQDLATLRALVGKRVQDGLTDAHYLALFLDPRPSMRQFVRASGLLGNAQDLSVGNTNALKAAQVALKKLVPVVPVEGQSVQKVEHALCKSLLIYLEVCSRVCIT